MSDGQSGSTTTTSAEERVPTRTCPLPAITWAKREHVWDELTKREKRHKMDMRVLSHHPEVTPRMRSVLIDWLMEVSEVYRLHRLTFFYGIYIRFSLFFSPSFFNLLKNLQNYFNL